MGVVIPQVVTEDKAGGAQVIDGGLRFDKSKSQHLKRTFSAGNRTTWTWSGWIKRSTLGGSANQQFFSSYTDGNNLGFAYFTTADIIRFDDYQSANVALVRTIPVYRDPSAWYHLTIIFDSTQSTSSDRVRIYINGTQVRDITSPTYPNSNTAGYVNNASAHYIGQSGGSSEYFDGEMSQVYFIDGQALEPSYFGYTDPLTNTWRPKKFRQETTTNGSYSINRVGRIFSTGISGSQDSSNQGSNGAFNGSIANFSTAGSYPNPGSTLTWTAANSSLGTTLPYTSTARVYVGVDLNGDAGGLTVVGANGSQTISTGVAGNSYGWVSITAATSPITSIAWSRAGGGSQGVRLLAVEIDGQILVDNAGFGLNGFYLPMDGNTPIGQDRSGTNNNWTPVNFGGSNTIEKATGALPILNTDGGGKVARVGVRTDSNASSLVLALPLVGIKSDFSNAINSGTSNKAVTANGNAVGVSTVSNFYGGSFAFDGNGTTGLTVTYTSDFDCSGTFTSECWVYGTQLGTYNPIICQWSSDSTGTDAWTLETVGTALRVYVTDQTYIEDPQPFALNRWQHFAVVYNGGILSLYRDGVLVVSASKTISASTLNYTVGRFHNNETSGKTWYGYIQDVRHYKGVAKYTQNFIPASTDPDILPDTPSGVAYSSNVALVPSTDGGAVTFDGTNDNLTIAASTDLNLSSGDFTVEGFVYPLRSQEQSLVTNWTTTSTGQFQVQMSSSGTLQASWAPYSTGVYAITGGTPIPVGVWSHFAYTRSGSTFNLFLNGISQGTLTSSANASSNTSIKIGENGDAGDRDLMGFVSNVHIVKGTALYTSNFTPPTAPIASVANTKLLCCKSNSREVNFDVAPTPSSLTASFNAALSATPFTDGSSSAISITNTNSRTTTSAGTNSFNITNAASFPGGSGANLTLGSSINRTGLYTIDLYVKPTLSQQSRMVTNDGTNAGQGISLATDGSINIYDFGNASLAPAGTIVAGNWYHLRFVFNNTTVVSSFVNGVRQITTGSVQNFAANTALRIGWGESGTSHSFDGLMGPVRIVSGDLGNPDVGGTPTSSGTLSNTPTPSNIASYGNAVATNFNPFTVNINTQRGQESGYATLNPIDNDGNTLSNGNLNLAGSGNNFRYTRSSTYVNEGKWYWECTIAATGGETRTGPQILRATDTLGSHSTGSIRGYIYISDYSGTIYISSNPSGSNSTLYSTSGSLPAGTTVGLALDAVNGRLWVSVNGIWLNGGNPGTGTNAPVTGLTGPYTPGGWAYNTSDLLLFTFGQKPFKFPPPAGFQPLALANTPRPSIVRPDQYVGVTTYTGNGGTQSINVGWKPDFVWIKQRSSPSRNHVLYDTVRGATKALLSSTTDSEQTYSTSLSSFDSNGFTLGSDDKSNGSTLNYVGWAWKAGGNSNTFNINDIGYSTASAAGLTAGTITPTGASVNTKSGFSIIGYTGNGVNGATLSHGLGKTPAFVIIKNRDNTSSYSWVVWHQSISQSIHNSSTFTLSGYTGGLVLNGANSSFTYSFDGQVNGSTEKHIAYLWAEIPGFSKFGSYTGNASTDGPVVITGFRPRWILIKKSSATGNVRGWVLVDSERSKYNVSNLTLFPHDSAAEDAGTYIAVDFLSNGFKLRSTEEAANQSYTYVYAAFAETPSFNLYGGQSNAR